MQSNFSFLKENWANLAEIAELAEENLYQDPNTTIVKLRMFTEQIVDYIYAYDDLEEPEENSFFNKLKLLEKYTYIKYEFDKLLDFINDREINEKEKAVIKTRIKELRKSI